MTTPEIERQERLQVTAADGTTHRFYTHDEVQAAIAAAMMGAVDIARHEADLIDKRAAEMGRPANSEEAVTARGIAGLILLAIPTDAAPALEEIKRQVLMRSV
jgi:hypothetical protein